MMLPPVTCFRPCIDLHGGVVKQIVGGSLRDAGPGPTENHVSERPAPWFAKLYRGDDCLGGHVIKLGPGNEAAAQAALAAWPGGLQIGGGITPDNAADWIRAGAAKVIVTSALFDGPRLDRSRLQALVDAVGADALVLDLSCRRVADGWRVATDRWQTITELPVTQETLAELADSCSEFLIHAADVEGLQGGIDEDLVRLLGTASPIPCTYAGGARSVADLDLVAGLSDNAVDLTIGSALDIFGGNGATYADCIAWNRQHADSK